MNLKKTIKFSGWSLLILFILYYLGSYGFSFPPCSNYEIPLDPPDLMKTSDIIFEKQMYYILPPGKDTKASWIKCQNLKAEATGLIQSSSIPYQSTRYQTIPIPKNTRFKLVRRASVEARGMMGLGGGTGDYYLLKDDTNNTWYIAPIYFLNNGRVGDKNEPKWIAGYYSGNERIGDVIVKDEWLCNRDGKIGDLCSKDF